MGGLNANSIFDCKSDFFWSLTKYRDFTQVEISDQSSFLISVNVVALAVYFSITKCTGRLIEESNNHLLSHLESSPKGTTPISKRD